MTRKQPNFFILGAPKCGTTSLARWLDAHPGVFVSPIKEPHYFSTDLANRAVTSFSRYQQLFDDATDAHRAIGEASTWYLYSKVAVENIEQAYPGARYIVMTRDPVSMANSLYHHNVRVLHEDQPTFEAAWRLEKDRAAGESVPTDCVEPAFLRYREACALGSLMERLLSRVPPERILHIPLEAMKEDPGREYRRALAFLGVPDDGRTDFPVANVARGHRSRLAQQLLRWGSRIRMRLGIKHGTGLASLNDRAAPKQTLSEGFRSELEEYFAPERQLIAALATKLQTK